MSSVLRIQDKDFRLHKTRYKTKSENNQKGETMKAKTKTRGRIFFPYDWEEEKAFFKKKKNVVCGNRTVFFMRYGDRKEKYSFYL